MSVVMTLLDIRVTTPDGYLSTLNRKDGNGIFWTDSPNENIICDYYCQHTRSNLICAGIFHPDTELLNLKDNMG
jgi:hypothetical protein